MNEDQNKYQLPIEWQIVTLRDVCRELQSGKRPKGGVQGIGSGVPSIGAEHLDFNGGFKFSKIKFVPADFARQMRKGIIQKDDIIVVKDGATTGKSSFVNNNFPYEFAVINEHVFIVRVTENILPRFAFYKIWSSTGNKEILKDFRGAAQGGISSGFIDKVIIPLPPKHIQKAIVCKIEQLFSELDKGVENLHTAQLQLKTYRQSVLKWAFEGKLTNENVKDGELPKKWKWVKLGELMESVRNGYSKKPDETGQYKILRISSVRPNKVYIDETRCLEKEIGIENSLAENDLLFTRYNGTIDFVGVCGRVPKLEESLFYPDKLIRCRPKIKEWFHSAYIDYAANSRLARQFVLSKIKTTAGQTGISGSDIKEIPVPLPPLEEQNIIVQEIESRLSVADKMEESITQSLQQAEALRQSILKKAFEGKLV